MSLVLYRICIPSWIDRRGGCCVFQEPGFWKGHRTCRKDILVSVVLGEENMLTHRSLLHLYQ